MKSFLKLKSNLFALLLFGIVVLGVFFFIRYLSSPEQGVVRYDYPVRERLYRKKQKRNDKENRLSKEERRKMRMAYEEKRRAEEKKIRKLISTTQGKIDYLLHYYPKSGPVLDSILKYGKDARGKKAFKHALMEVINRCKDGSIPIEARNYLKKRYTPDHRLSFMVTGSFFNYLSDLSPPKGKDIEIKKFIDHLIIDAGTHPAVKGALIFNIPNRYLMDHRPLIRSFVTHENIHLSAYSSSFCTSIKDKECIPQLEKLLRKYKDKGLEDSSQAGVIENEIRYIQGKPPIPRDEAKRRRERFLQKFSK